MEVTNYWPPLPCQGKLQVQQVTCGLVVLTLGIIFWWKLNLNIYIKFRWTSVWLGARQPGKPNMDIRKHLSFIIIWNHAIFDLKYKLTCIGFLRFHFPAGAWLDHLNCSKKALAFLLLVFRQSVHRCLGWSFLHDSKCVKTEIQENISMYECQTSGIV